MNYLFLDDDEQRQTTFKAYFDKNCLKDDKLVQTRTAKETIEALQNETFVMISLDHDLGGEIFVTKTEETGYEVALYIETMPEEKLPKTIVIHSYNPQGAERMYNAMKSRNIYLYKVPFNIQ